MALNRELKTQGIALLIYGITGEYPEIEKYDTYNEIKLSSEQVEQAQGYLLKTMSAEPGEIRIDAGQIINPVLFKKYWPFILGVPAGMLLLGVMLRK